MFELILRRRQTPPLGAEPKAPLSINPEQTPGFSLRKVEGLFFTPQADSDLREMEDDPSKKNILKAVRKTLGFMETSLRHPSLNTHEFTSLKGPNGEKVFEAYV